MYVYMYMHVYSNFRNPGLQTSVGVRDLIV